MKRFATLVVVVIGTLLCALSASANFLTGTSAHLRVDFQPGVMLDMSARDPSDMEEEMYIGPDGQTILFNPNGINCEKGLILVTSALPSTGARAVGWVVFRLDGREIGQAMMKPPKKGVVQSTFLVDPPEAGVDEEAWLNFEIARARRSHTGFWAFATKSPPFYLVVDTGGLMEARHAIEVAVKQDGKRPLAAATTLTFRVARARDAETGEPLDLNDEPINGRRYDGPGFYGGESRGLGYSWDAEEGVEYSDTIPFVHRDGQQPAQQSETRRVSQAIPLLTEAVPAQAESPACTCRSDWLRSLHAWLEERGYEFECADIVGTHEFTLSSAEEGPVVIYSRVRNGKPIRPTKIKDPKGVEREQFVTLIVRDGQPASLADLVGAGAEEKARGSGYTIFKDADSRCWLVRESEVLGRLDFRLDDGRKTPVGVLYYHRGVDVKAGDELTFCTGLPTRVGVHGPTFPVPEGGALVVLDCDESGKPIKSQ